MFSKKKIEDKSSTIFDVTSFVNYDQVYAYLLNELLIRGTLSSERNGAVVCRRLQPIHYCVRNVYNCEPFFYIPNRNWGLKIALAEIDWILRGKLFLSETEILKYAPNLEKFKTEDEEYFWAQYGSRLRAAGQQENDYYDTELPVVDQLQEIVNRIECNDAGYLSSNRRLVASLWQPALDTVDGKLDYPCNICIIFNVRPVELSHTGRAMNYIDITVIRRSNDIVWGLQNNFVQFWSVLQHIVWELTKKFPQAVIQAGTHYETVNNLHMYVKHSYGEAYDKPVRALLEWHDNFCEYEVRQPLYKYTEDLSFAFSPMYNGDEVSYYKFCMDIKNAMQKNEGRKFFKSIAEDSTHGYSRFSNTKLYRYLELMYTKD